MVWGFNGDFNDVLSQPLTVYTMGPNVQNAPTTSAIAFKAEAAYNNDRVVQQVWSLDNTPKHYYRVKLASSWTPWMLVYDHGLLSNTSELSSLASALGVPKANINEFEPTSEAQLESLEATVSYNNNFSGLISNIPGYAVGYRGGTNGKSAAIIMADSQILCALRNYNTSEGKWVYFKVV